MAPIQQAPEILLAQRLASNEKPTRTKAIKKLRKYISLRSQNIKGKNYGGYKEWASGCCVERIKRGDGNRQLSFVGNVTTNQRSLIAITKKCIGSIVKCRMSLQCEHVDSMTALRALCLVSV